MKNGMLLYKDSITFLHRHSSTTLTIKGGTKPNFFPYKIGSSFGDPADFRTPFGEDFLAPLFIYLNWISRY